MRSFILAASRRVIRGLDVLFSAGRVSGAVESGAVPAGRDLARLGIDPAKFRAIRTI